MFSWILIFNTSISDHIKGRSHLPVWQNCHLSCEVCLCCQWSEDILECNSICLISSYLSEKGHTELFCSSPTDFQCVPYVMSHLQNNGQKQVPFLYSHIRQWGPSFILGFKVLVVIPVSLYHHQLNNIQKKERDDAQGGQILVYSESFILMYPTGTSCKPVD
jgi:hypothetical protein